jgi:hypothetical protein
MAKFLDITERTSRRSPGWREDKGGLGLGEALKARNKASLGWSGAEHQGRVKIIDQALKERLMFRVTPRFASILSGAPSSSLSKPQISADYAEEKSYKRLNHSYPANEKGQRRKYRTEVTVGTEDASPCAF